MRKTRAGPSACANSMASSSAFAAVLEALPSRSSLLPILVGALVALFAVRRYCRLDHIQGSTYALCFILATVSTYLLKEETLSTGGDEVRWNIRLYCLFCLITAMTALVPLSTIPGSVKYLLGKSGVGVALPYRRYRQCAYLDYNATSPIFPEVSREMLPFLGECFGNPSSAHVLGRASKSAVDKARMRVAKMLGCTTEEILFVASGSEADNHAIFGALVLYARKNEGKFATPGARPHVISSSIEHPAITKCLMHQGILGKLDVTMMMVDPEGRVRPEAVIDAMDDPGTALVTIMHSNNEVGSLQPIKEIAAACRKRGIICHTDAAQSIGKVKVKVSDLGVDMLTVVGHKFGAPKGVAALYVRKGLSLPSMIHGGGQESGRRAGTENVMLIAGMGKAAEIVDRELEQLSEHLRKMRSHLLELLVAGGLGEGVQIHGPRDPALRLPNTLSIGVPGLEAHALVEMLSETVAISAGSACHAGEVHVSPVMNAMRVEKSVAIGTIRLSVGRHTTKKEVSRAAAAILQAAKTLLAAKK